MGFVILCAVRRWVCWRLDFKVRAVLGLCDVGVLGLERDGILEIVGREKVGLEVWWFVGVVGW